MADRTPPDFDAIVVGAGFAGLYMLHRLRGLGYRARVFETGEGVGGTWYWNRYPGARCDIESLEYSYQFDADLQQEWNWSERYAPQAEILRYVEHVAERFDLKRDVQLATRVCSAHFDDASGLWQIETESAREGGGERAQHSARFCIMATGCLSATNIPDFPGQADFEGDTWHTGRWPHEGVDFRGRRVAMIGTGSSAVQSIPLIAAEAEQLTVFQRTPTYAVPAHNAPLDPELEARVKSDYPGFRALAAGLAFGANFPPNPTFAVDVSEAEREEVYETRWQTGGLGFITAFGDLISDREANQTAAEFVRGKIRQLVHDPAVAETLSPTQVLGCKRLCVDTGYYETFNRKNVSLVDVSETPIEAFTSKGIVAAGREYVVDGIVYATGYDAMTGALARIDIRGSGGRALSDKWSAGPTTYLGLGTSGFPNLFVITGPGSPSVLANMVPAIEQHVNWIADCLAHLQRRGATRIEARPEAEAAWVEHTNEVAYETLFPFCNSWYLGANVPGKPRVFMPYIGFPTYVAKCEEVAAKGYEGFQLS